MFLENLKLIIRRLLKQKSSDCCDDEWVEWRCLKTSRISFYLSNYQSGCTYLSACSNDGRAKCMRVSLWQWHETGKKTKWVGTNKQKKKTDERKPNVPKKTQRDIHQHKHQSKWLILCTTEFKRNEQQHNMWVKYASENWIKQNLMCIIKSSSFFKE